MNSPASAPYGLGRTLWPLFQKVAVASGRIASNAVFPRRCLTCAELIPDKPYTYLCPACASHVEPCCEPSCVVCALPFWTFEAEAVSPGAICGLCLSRPPRFESARSMGLYRGYLKDLILMMKYRPEAKAAFALAGLMAQAYTRLFGAFEPDAVVPVPLHTERFLEREFDQSGLVAADLARIRGWPFGRWLMRRRPTPPQSRLSRSGRRANVRGAFGLTLGARPEGAAVLLVDDVLTTGATAREAARVLVRAGARSVHVYTAARVE